MLLSSNKLYKIEISYRLIADSLCELWKKEIIIFIISNQIHVKSTYYLFEWCDAIEVCASKIFRFTKIKKIRF